MTGKRRKSGRRAVARRRKPKSTATTGARARRKSAPRAAAKARKRPARKVAKRASRKRPATKVRKPVARKVTRRATRKRPTAAATRGRPVAKPRKPGPRRPTVLRPAKRAVVPAFPQRAGASSKQEVIFELVRARVAVHAAVQGLESGGATEPLVAGKWSVLEHVLHLIHWDDEVIQAMEAALRGVAPGWAGFDSAATDGFNAAGVEGRRHLAWEDARRALLTTRLRLIEEIEAIPEEPGETWSAQHAFGAMLRDIAENDRHHAEIIKRWRGKRGA